MNKMMIPLLALLLFACKSTDKATEVPFEEGMVVENAMVVSAHPEASKVGAEILRQGGNAWDAAVAVQFALAVVYQNAGNIGGGGFAVFRSREGEIGSLDFREKAPLAAGKDMYLDEEGNVSGRLSLEGHLAVGVPGSVDGMVQLHSRFGKLPWKDLVQPSVELARNGYALTEMAARGITGRAELFNKVNTHPILYVRDGGWKEGDLMVQEDLANTFERIRDKGRAGFYEGETARLFLEEMKRSNGIIVQEDFDRYQSVWRDPLQGDYRGHRIISMPPPSSGGVALLQLLESIEKYPVAKWGYNTSRTVQLMTEVEKRVYADRATFLGDPDYYDVPVQMLTSPDYLAERMASVNLKSTTPSEEIKEGNVEIVESVETTHFSVVDKEGNAVAITTTLNSGYGCKVMVKGAGFFLNNEMDDFSIKPGVPNQFGLVGAEANAIVPEKRMLSSMTPTIVEKDGELFMVVGTPGGSTIITSVFQTIVNVIDHGMTMQQAVNARRFHHQWLPDMILHETNAFPAETTTRLMEMGHKLQDRGAIGRVDAILVRDNTLEGAADPRGDDFAAGY
ncbi:MAG: gamma-glutamyltransferase [Saprospiraceae bacterium]|nr:gamma-glutamyltransferase [Saprospiraceae bacterium]